MLKKPQLKGEAEYAVADHLISVHDEVARGGSVLVEVTSRDHDLISILIHTVGDCLDRSPDDSHSFEVF
jgi:hypothetical protein